MKNLREQTDAKIAAGRKGNPDFMKGVDEIIEKAKAFKEGENALKVGEKAPNFTLPNPEEKLLYTKSLSLQLKQITTSCLPPILIFYIRCYIV